MSGIAADLKLIEKFTPMRAYSALDALRASENSVRAQKKEIEAELKFLNSRARELKKAHTTLVYFLKEVRKRIDAIKTHNAAGKAKKRAAVRKYDRMVSISSLILRALTRSPMNSTEVVAYVTKHPQYPGYPKRSIQSVLSILKSQGVVSVTGPVRSYVYSLAPKSSTIN